MKNAQNNNSKNNKSSSVNAIPQNYPFTQICQTDNLCLSRKLGCIFKILDVSVDISISRFKTIVTPVGKTLIVDAIKIIKLTYTNHNTLNVDCAKFKVPVCLSIPLKNIDDKIEKVNVSVQNISHNQITENQLSVSMIILAYPIFKNKSMASMCNNTPTKAVNTQISTCSNNNEQLLANIIILIIIFKFFNNGLANPYTKRLC